jgi:hypothetical protein
MLTNSKLEMGNEKLEIANGIKQPENHFIIAPTAALSHPERVTK